MVLFGWFVRILAIVAVGFGAATAAFQSRKISGDSHAPGKLIVLLIAFWCIIALFGLAVLAETYTSIKPQWLAITLTGIECFLWAAILVEFGFHQNYN